MKFKDIEKKEIIEILSVGWIYDLKNQIDILKSINMLEKGKCKVTFAGGTKDQVYYEKLIDYIEKNFLSGIVEFTGEIKDIEKYFNKADMYILTSKSEALPTVLIEGLNYNLPIISKDCKHGPREILCNEKYGLLYQGDENELKEKILEMIDNKKYNEFREKSFERANDFSYEKILKEYIKVIEGIK